MVHSSKTKRYILRDGPTSQVFAYDGITEVPPKAPAARVRVAGLHYLHGAQCGPRGVRVHLARTGT